jgi:ABC-type glycerol-3-phosphate transport system substrate-binding protein
MLPMGAALYTVGDEIQALPLGLATYVLYYNVDWLSDVGFTASKATWTELQGAACAATDPAGGQVGLGLPAEPAILLALLTSAGAQITDDAGLYQFADVNGLTLASNLNAILGGMCAYVYDDPTEGATRLSNSSLALIVESSLNWSGVEKAVLEGRNFSLALSATSGPSGPGRTLWYGPGLMLIAPEGTRRVAAAEVLTWFFSAEAQATWNAATAYLPIRRTLIEDNLAAAPEIRSLEVQLWQLTLDAADSGAWVAWPRYTNKMACRASLLRALLSLGNQPTPGAYIEAAATACNTGVK